MRSRYTAFVKQDWAYLNRTQSMKDEVQPSAEMVWLGLEILATHAGGAEDNEGTVEFIAHYSHQSVQASLHEISRFKKSEGQWLYVGGTFPRSQTKVKSGRNDPCPCGSGNKFKKCCGSN
jgi:SEC-C motif-containing protein